MKSGYAQVSTADQKPDSQTDALKAAGCDKIIIEKISGAQTKRPKLDSLLGKLQENDILVVWRLDRLGRSLSHLIEIITDLEKRSVHFQSSNEGIDTTTAQGRLLFHMMGALAEFERSLIVERTKAGIDSARKRGVRIGRPKALTQSQIKHAQKLIDNGETITEIARTMGNHPILNRIDNQTSCSLFQFHGGGYSADGHVGPFVVVCP